MNDSCGGYSAEPWNCDDILVQDDAKMRTDPEFTSLQISTTRKVGEGITSSLPQDSWYWYPVLYAKI